MSIKAASKVLNSSDKVKLFDEITKQSKTYNVDPYNDAFVVMVDQNKLVGLTVIFDKLPNVRETRLNNMAEIPQLH